MSIVECKINRALREHVRVALEGVYPDLYMNFGRDEHNAGRRQKDMVLTGKS